MKITPAATESQHSTPNILKQDSASIDNLFQQVKEMAATYLHDISDSPTTLAEVPALALGLLKEGVGAAALLAGLQLNKVLKGTVFESIKISILSTT